MIPEGFSDKITPKTRFKEDLGNDSLEKYELGYAIEEKLGIIIPDEEIAYFKSFGDYIEYIEKNTSL